MASTTPHPEKRSGPPLPRTPAKPTSALPEVVDPVWLLKAAGVAILVALICGYLTLCLLFYQGQWQLVLHPNRSIPAPTNIAGVPIETIRFGVDESGLPQLTGWWLPAAPAGRYAAETILYLPRGDGSLADAEPTLAVLHSLGINIFAFDYRGYGQSAATHPNQRRMTQDTASAFQYLTVSRGIQPAQIVPFGDGVGAALAAELSASHSEIPQLILQSPRIDVLNTVRNDPRVRLLPVRALFHDTFDLSASVARLRTAKLFLLADGSTAADVARSAADPKVIVTLPGAERNGAAWLEQVARFLDQRPVDRSTLGQQIRR